jgi:anti-anti-sigma factor
MNQAGTILVGYVGEVFWVRVDGRATFQNSPEIRACLVAEIEQGTEHIVIDLEQCTMMDSTFLGTLAGTGLRLQGLKRPSLQLVNPNTRNRQLLRNLGLDHILEVDDEGTAWPAQRRAVNAELSTLAPSVSDPTTGKKDRAEVVLKAHQALGEANPSNIPRFRDVVRFLEDEVMQRTSAQNKED